MINLSQYFTKIKGELYKNTSLAPLTWFKVGGPAEFLFIPENKEDLVAGTGYSLKYPTIVKDSALLLKEKSRWKHLHGYWW